MLPFCSSRHGGEKSVFISVEIAFHTGCHKQKGIAFWFILLAASHSGSVFNPLSHLYSQILLKLFELHLRFLLLHTNFGK